MQLVEKLPHNSADLAENKGHWKRNANIIHSQNLHLNEYYAIFRRGLLKYAYMLLIYVCCLCRSILILIIIFAGTEEHQKVWELLSKAWSLIEPNLETFAIQIFRLMFKRDPDLFPLFPFYKDEWSRVAYTDYSGSYPEQPPNSWFVVFRYVKTLFSLTISNRQVPVGRFCFYSYTRVNNTIFFTLHFKAAASRNYYNSDSGKLPPN